MRRPLRRLLAILKEALAAATFAQGDGAEEVLLRRLHLRLEALRRQARKIRTGAAVVLGACVIALAVTPLALRSGGPVHAVASAVLALFLGASALAAVEASRIVTLIDALEDLLCGSASLDHLEALQIFRQHIELMLKPEPDWGPLVSILCAACGTPAAIQVKLARASIRVELVNMNQAPLYIWHEALRLAHRGQKVEALLASFVSDENVSAYHAPLLAWRARLAG